VRHACERRVASFWSTSETSTVPTDTASRRRNRRDRLHRRQPRGPNLCVAGRFSLHPRERGGVQRERARPIRCPDSCRERDPGHGRAARIARNVPGRRRAIGACRCTQRPSQDQTGPRKQGVIFMTSTLRGGRRALAPRLLSSIGSLLALSAVLVLAVGCSSTSGPEAEPGAENPPPAKASRKRCKSSAGKPRS